MATVDKNFRVKNGLNVAGTATFDTGVVIGSAPIAFDSTTGRLKIQVNGSWVSFAHTADIVDATSTINFMDIGLAIDYDGNPTYIVQANGVYPSGTSKFADGGTPTTTNFDMYFDPGTI